MFNPTLETRLVIDGVEYTFSPHPVVPTLVWGQEGRHAIVYRMEAQTARRRPLDRANGNAYALKVFRPAFRHPGLLASAEALSWAHELPGMQVCDQRVITQETHPDLVARYDDLDYAMVMPWIEGQTWFDYLQKRERVSLDQSRALAENMAWVLYALELNHLAHCDLSSGNVIVEPSRDGIHLVDVEDLYSPWLTPPPMVPAGTPGYQHEEATDEGQWRPTGDRFAGAVLLAEMLGWAHPDVRKAAYGESYFAPEELQRETERYDILIDVLRAYDPGFAETFEAVWRSESLEKCPPLSSWYDLLDALPRGPVASWAEIDPDELDVDTPPPPDIALPVEVASGPADAGESRAGWLRGRRGCRITAVAVGVIALLLCYAVFLAFEWSLLKDLF
jgi:serine/threonine protein kinase